MSRTTRLFLILLVAGIALFSVSVSLAAAAVYRAGSIAVEVQERDGDRVSVKVPAGLVRIAIALTPGSLLREAAADAQPWIPAARAGWNELSQAPDFVLVEFEGADEHISIEKTKQMLMVRVESPEADVRVGIPLSTVGSLLAKLDDGRRRG